MVKIVIDPDSSSLSESYAVIKTPRKKRERFPEASVTCVADEATAFEQADQSKNSYPAIVYGPSVSSECQRIYYLLRWL